MAKKKTTIVHFHCKECNRANYTLDLNKKNTPKLELSKYCRQCRKSTTHVNKDTKSK